MNQKVVLITGCSSGIGLALAVRLAKNEKKRFMVYATMRNLAKREALVEAAGRTLGRTLEINQLDMCDENSIKACMDNLPMSRVDILISNAGMGMIDPIECQTIDEMKTVMDTNFFGLVRLLKEILPGMKKRKSGHIVVISSVMGIQGEGFKQGLTFLITVVFMYTCILLNDIYTASKFAVEGFCESLAVQALRFNLNISLIEPGPVITEFESKVYEEGVKIDLSKADKVTSICCFSYNQHTFKMITKENPPFRHQTNSLYTPMTTLKYADPNGDLPIETFYKMVFEHDKVFSASLSCAGEAVRASLWVKTRMPLKECSAGDLGVFQKTCKAI
uniref:Zgc:109982 n=1 Tax=Sinocyclocheilus grahami TaxID=75366 RepID=A0A672S0T1_SINGR